MKWLRWDSLAAFEDWHEAVKRALGLPKPGFNAATGAVDTSAPWTTDYTQPVAVSTDDVRALVEAEVSELVPYGIGVASDPPPEPVSDSVT